MHLGSFDIKVGSPEVKVNAMCDDEVHCLDMRQRICFDLLT